MLSLFGDAVSAAYHIVSAFAHVLAPVTGALATAAAIVAFTIAVRLLLLPLSYYSIRGQAAQARLLPQVQELQKRHAGNPDRLQRDLAALYQREGAGLLAGCLPALLQLPFLSVLYRLFRSGTIDGQRNTLLSHDLLGVPLGHHWLSAPGLLSAPGAVFLGLFALLAAVAWAGTRIARRAERPGPSGPTPPGGSAQPAGAVGVLIRVVPYATVVVAAVLPLAAGLYLLTTTAWSAAERAVLGRRLLPPTRRPAAPDPDRPALAKPKSQPARVA